MKIKTNTKKILILLYSKNQPKKFFPIEHIKLLWSNLSNSGRKSLYRHLLNKGYLNLEFYQGKECLSLTRLGEIAIESAWPNLSLFWSSHKAEWRILILTHAPSFDREFRQLRNFLKKNGVINLHRGVYLFSQNLDRLIINFLVKGYSDAVYCWELSGLLFGHEKIPKTEQKQKDEEVAIYSEISKDLIKLLKKKDDKKTLTNKEIQEIFKIFNRFFDLIDNSSGLFLTSSGIEVEFSECLGFFIRLLIR